MLNWTKRRSCVASDERGVAMIVVIGLGAALAVLVTSLTVLAVNNLRQAGLQGRGEQALHAADASLDWVLEELRTSDGTTPADPAVDADPDTPEIDPFTDEQQEREAVLTAADDLIAASPSRLVTSPSGQWVALRPQDADGTDLTGTAYGVSYIPSRANPDRIRVLRAEYLVSIFETPGAALLSNGNIRFTSQVDVNGAVHANGDLYSSSTLNATSTITSSGSTCENCTVGGAAGSGPNKPAQEVPPVRPRDYYDLGMSGSTRWDMCPDGTVRLPATEDAPCTGTVVSSSGSFRGWSFEGGSSPMGKTWKHLVSTRYDGIYYFYQSNAFLNTHVGNSGNPWRVTIITETERSPDFEETTAPASHCPHVGGDIIMSAAMDLQAHPEAENVLFLAGRDVFNGSSTHIHGPPNSNMIYAHEQILFTSNLQLDGGMVAENACNTPGSTVQQTEGIQLTGEASINFDGGGAGSDQNTVKTTIWSEI
jgi:hypothetical protein